ncbi:unnamed protein product [Cochlearia groenlandica]
MVLEAVTKIGSPPLIDPRISFSSDLSDGGDLICIASGKEIEKESTKVSDFEFLSENVSPQRILTADQLFSDGKFLPFGQIKHSEKLKNLNFNTNKQQEEVEENPKEEVTMKKKKDKEEDHNRNRVSWFIDEDPSPRPPKCTVLWKELLRLKKQRNSSARTVSYLSPSSSTSSSSSSLEEREKREEEEGKRCKKKGLERTRSATMRIRPMIHVPVYNPSYKSSVSLMPPLFPISLKKNRVERQS